jgi:glutamine amidotransferase
MIVIIDYGMGNLRSVAKSLERLKINAITSSQAKDIRSAEKIILPGVGHFAQGMKNLAELGLIDLLNQKVLNEKTPFLGICLGMQLVTQHSDEGNCDGLGWMEAQTKSFKDQKLDPKLKIPHMGWNNILVKQAHPFLNGQNSDDVYYFVHSYYVQCQNAESILATTTYGLEFASLIYHENILGTQFHPEKSHKQGLNLIKNFAETCHV